ncbi:protein of unknown function (plasmid) [Cupriavidus neocaledonicus]|uniref:Uncharacterized protein n=1 Tax=Cupriavidus neocaledonicus TaxID=1040979 RepID=A0A375HTX4_9BURK|nr:hypothetical protein CBM2605_B100122 [Cupriavidus neocaledonicus]SPD60190.1 protein of unknown function [Cupriavidus neocaledonicus]
MFYMWHAGRQGARDFEISVSISDSS